MASYTITTTVDQEEALDFAYLNYGEEFASKEEYLQDRINHTVLDAMVIDHIYWKNTALAESLDTIPDENKAAAQTAIEQDIVQYGGEVKEPKPPKPVKPPKP